MFQRIAILGGGPAGAALGAFLAQQGRDVVIFTRSKRPPIIVGESLVPAVVPFLRRLGVEDEIAAYSIWKGGATFVFGELGSMSFRFNEVRQAITTYSYNVPRDKFDATLLEAARRAGARIMDSPARLERDGEDGVKLTDETLASIADFGTPDFIVDASGRNRVIPQLLDIPSIDGDRKDTALHAHFEGVEIEIEGNVHTDRLDHGRVSMGIVIDSDFIAKFGSSPEEQMDAYLKQDSVLRDFARPARRVTPVIKYTNYQSRMKRGVGRNWALVGDTFGFVDPVFSSGMLIAMQSASALAEALVEGSQDALADYERETQHALDSWHRVVSWFYNGRLLTLFRVGQWVQKTLPGRLLDFHFRKHMPRIFTGEDATNRYSLGLVSFMTQYGLAGNDPDLLRIN
jgi:flavin-dependent dehydrogenase